MVDGFVYDIKTCQEEYVAGKLKAQSKELVDGS